MKTKRLLCSLFLSALVGVIFITSLFRTVKAADLPLSPGTTTAYGYYVADTYQPTANNIGEIAIGDPAGIFQFTVPLDNHSSAFHFTYYFKECYSGSIEITVKAASAYVLNECTFAVDGGWFHKNINTTDTNGIPNLSTNSANKKFIIDFVDSDHIDFLLVHPNTLVFTNSTVFTLSLTTSSGHSLNEWLEDIYGQVGNSATYLSNIQSMLNTMGGHTYDAYLNSIEGSLDAIWGECNDIAVEVERLTDYVIDPESYLAYWYVMSGAATDYDNQPDIMKGDVGAYLEPAANHRTRVIRFYEGQEFYFYYYSDTSGTALTSSANYVVVQNTDIPPAMGGWRLKCAKLTYTGNDTDNPNGQTAYMSFPSDSSPKIVPIYFGDGTNMSQQMQSITKHRSSTYTTDLLEDILAQLTELVGPNVSADTTAYNNIIHSVSTFFQSVIDIIPSSLPINEQISGLPPLFGDNATYDLVGVGRTINWFYNQFAFAFPYVKTIVILGLCIVAIKVFM